MWILINTSQFIVYIGMWQINFSDNLGVFFNEIKRVFLGEYIDDLAIGHKISNTLGFETNNDIDDPGQKVGLDRLGSTDISANFGPSFILGTICFILLIIMVLSLIRLCNKVTKLTRKNKERLEKIRKKFLYNPIIRYAFLNALKLNLVVMLTYKRSKD